MAVGGNTHFADTEGHRNYDPSRPIWEVGATDPQIFIQFLLEALVLAALGALAGTFAGSVLCRALADKFPYGLVVSPLGLAAAWATALLLAVSFGLYPAIRASRLSPMAAMQ